MDTFGTHTHVIARSCASAAQARAHDFVVRFLGVWRWLSPLAQSAGLAFAAGRARYRARGVAPMIGRMKRFPRTIAEAIGATRYLKIRAGGEHRFVWIWVVVDHGRVFVRSWNDKPKGWYRAFLTEKRGAIVVNDQEMPVKAARVRAAATNDAVCEAYAAKYTTKANQRYVKGFASATRKANTLELTP